MICEFFSSEDFMSSLTTFYQIFCKNLDWSGFEPEAFPVQGGRYTRFNYQPPLLHWKCHECNIHEKNKMQECLAHVIKKKEVIPPQVPLR